MAELLLLFLMGLFGGFLAGLIGIGGGVMYILVLPYLLTGMGFPQEEIVQYTIANSIFGTMFAALAGNISHIKQKFFFWKEVAMIGVIGTIASISTLHFFVNTSAYQKSEFNIAVIGIMLFIAFRTLLQVKKPVGGLHEKPATATVLTAIGFSAGTISALSGLGGGTIIIPVLNSGLKMSMMKAKSISLGVIFITAFALTVFNLNEAPMNGHVNQNTGYIVWPLALTISLGVILGSPIGVLISKKLSNKVITIIFVFFVFVVIIDKALQLL